MYEVYVDGHLLYSDNIENLKIFNTKITLEVNKTGSFSFTIWPNHPYYNLIYKLKSIVTVYQDDYVYFRGRVLDDDLGFHNEKNIKCEGELAFFLDSLIRPYEYSGSIEGFLSMLIDTHNSQVEEEKHFKLGKVTVTDPNNTIVRSSIDSASTWKVIEDKLIKLLGGYISARHEDDVVYIDYLKDFKLISSQKVEFAKNLLDMKRVRKGSTIATALVPYGAKLKDSEGNDTDARLTIESVNDGLDYIYDEDAGALYGGKIFTTHTWDDVTVAGNLLTKAKEYLASLTADAETIELSAADLAAMNKDVTSFHLGTYVPVTSKPHGVDQNFLVSKISIDILKPASNKLTLGGVIQSFTTQSINNFNNISAIKGADGKDGKDGADGKGITSTTITYQVSESGTTAPTGEWSSTIPEVAANEYLWTKTVITYTDKTTSTAYSIGKIGADGKDGSNGQNGKDGADGKDGKGISSTVITYQASTSGTTIPTGTWSATIPSVSASQYLWTRTVITYTDSTTSTAYSVGMMGANGKDGADGKDAAIQSATAPSDTSFLWVDTSVDPPVLKRHNGTGWVVVNDNTKALQELEENLTATIETSSTNVLATVSEKYYLKDETESLVQELSTELELTKDSFDVTFTQYNADLNALIEGTDAEFEEIRKYIRFSDGKILLGEVGNELELQIANDRISFLQNGAEVAYFTNRKLYVTDGEYTNSLTLGQFAFIPRTNGNLSFKKMN